MRFRSNLIAPGARLSRVELWQAIDRPTRLELEISAEPDGPGIAESLARAAPGAEVEVFSFDGETSLFRGVVERRGARVVRGVEIAHLVAWPRWETRRRCVATEASYHRLSDAEIAARVAEELGLESRVDATAEVHLEVRRRGDPLAFLRDRARGAGRVLAIARGVLWFVERVPDAREILGLAARPLGLVRDSIVGEWEWSESRLWSASACLRFDLGWEPLATVRVEDGAFGVRPGADEERRPRLARVVRARHTVDDDGAVSRVTIAERVEVEPPEDFHVE